jgi:hypothetical protein
MQQPTRAGSVESLAHDYAGDTYYAEILIYSGVCKYKPRPPAASSPGSLRMTKFAGTWQTIDNIDESHS